MESAFNALVLLKAPRESQSDHGEFACTTKVRFKLDLLENYRMDQFENWSTEEGRYNVTTNIEFIIIQDVLEIMP